MDSLAMRYHLDLACAFIRGSLTQVPALRDEELFQHGLRKGMRLHKFKRMSLLPRVRRVFGLLRQLEPVEILDVGSGRGAFLWPLLTEFPELQVHCIDIREDRVRDICAVATGGVDRLTASVGDVTGLSIPDKSVEGLTMLEVLEHIPEPALAVAEAVRVARRFVIVSVPSKPDDNPEHIHLFSARTLAGLFNEAGVAKVSVDYVHNHIVALATLTDMP